MLIKDLVSAFMKPPSHEDAGNGVVFFLHRFVRFVLLPRLIAVDITGLTRHLGCSTIGAPSPAGFFSRIGTVCRINTLECFSQMPV